MPYRSSFFRSSGFRLRLGLGLGLVLGSTSLALAAALLASLATPTTPAVRSSWAAAPASEPSSTKLNRTAVNNLNFQPFLLYVSAGQLRYAVAGTKAYPGYAAPLPRPVLYRPPLRGPGSEPAYLSAQAGPLRVVQRSWGTIKRMFR